MSLPCCRHEYDTGSFYRGSHIISTSKQKFKFSIFTHLLKIIFEKLNILESKYLTFVFMAILANKYCTVE